MKRISQPAYSFAAVKHLIKIANLQDLKAMSFIIRIEQKCYDWSEFNVLILLISYRLVELSKQIRKKHAGEQTGDAREIKIETERRVLIHHLN